MSEANVSAVDLEGDFSPLPIDEIITEFLRGIVSRPESIVVTIREEGSQKILRIEADPADCGQIIGRHGWMATMIRLYLGVYGARTRQYFMTEIIGKDGRPQDPLPPLSTHDIENMQGSNNQSQDEAGQKAIIALEAFQDAFEAMENSRRPPSRFGANRPAPRHFRSPRPR
jgi:predicted RNA-binding protein YlqC (UPF0109 family)